MTIRAVFEKGVFRPTEQVKLAERTVMDLQMDQIYQERKGGKQ